MAASHKEEKYVDLGAPYVFEPVAVETLGLGSIQRISASVMILEGGFFQLGR